MKILFLSPIGDIGGAERVLLTAIGSLRRERPDIAIGVLMLSAGPLAEAVSELGAEAIVLPLPPALAAIGDSDGDRVSTLIRIALGLPTVAGFIRKLRRAIVRFGPDIVHSNGMKTHLLARFAVPARIRVVWHIHDFLGTRPLAGRLLRRARSHAGAAVAVSEAVATDARSSLPGLRIEVIPNAVDLAHFAPGPGDGADLDRRAGLPPAPLGTLRVGLVATYARWKGHHVVLDAAARTTDLPVRWFLIGGPIYRTAAQFTEAELRAAVEARGLAERVGFIPFVADTAPIYRALDVVLHASTQPEPFGLTIAEAMACGRPVVVSAAGGAVELFTEEIDALGVSPGDAGALAEAVRRLTGDPELRLRLGSAARRTAEARFDATDYAKRLLAFYAFLDGGFA